jgi:hypothetical protein
MLETRRKEHARLQNRTDQLRRDTRALRLDRTPFNGADHRQHLHNLAEHRADLQAYKRRGPDPSSD